MTAYVCPRWRNFIAKSEPMSVSGQMNTAIEIDLRPQLLQGAKPIDMDVINEKKFQGAFWLNFKALTSPKFGRLEQGWSGTGWRYYPKKDYVGQDSFDFVLNNGTQDSEVATVTIDVTPGLSGNIVVYKTQGADYWMLTGSHSIPPGFAPYDMITYTWIKKIPTRRFINMQPFIFTHYEVIYTSQIESGIYNKPKTKYLAARTDWELSVWPDPKLSGYLPNSSVPYIQPEGPFPYILKIDFYSGAEFADIYSSTLPRTKIGTTFDYWKVHDTIELEVTQACGEDWYKNGNIVYVEKDDPSYPDI